MSAQQFEHDGFNSPHEVEVANRIISESEKLYAAYAEGRKDGREAADATIAELRGALKAMNAMWVSACNPRGWEPDHMAQYTAAVAAIQSAEGTKP